MSTKYPLGALLAVVAALLVVASPAMAKGGGGGGGGGGDGCAQILSFSNTPGTNADGTPTVTTAYTVQQGCLDTFGAPVALDFKNNSTGFTGREVNMTPLGTWSYSRTWNATPGVKFTITLTVYKPGGGGKVEGTQTQTVTVAA